MDFIITTAFIAIASLLINWVTVGWWNEFLIALFLLPIVAMKKLVRRHKSQELDEAIRERTQRINSGAVNYIKMGFDKQTAISKAEKDIVAEANRTLNEMKALE